MGGFNSSTDNVVQVIAGQSGGLWSAPAFWNNTLYEWGQLGTLHAFTLTNGRFSTTPTGISQANSGFPGSADQCIELWIRQRWLREWFTVGTGGWQRRWLSSPKRWRWL